MSERSEHAFLHALVADLLSSERKMQQEVLVLPGKRPAVFIKKILKEQGYSGFLPEFITIEELITGLSGLQALAGVPLWLFAFDTYRTTDSREDLHSFLKWYPTIQKDWDDILKFAESDAKVLDYMLSEERIKNWGELLGEDKPHIRHLDFWKKMNAFLPKLKERLLSDQKGTAGVIYETAKEKIPAFVEATDKHYWFCGFNALTPVDEKLIRSLLQAGKAECRFEADAYYLDDERQEAGKFLREIQKWPEFNDHRPFQTILQGFSQPKNIEVYEASGNVAQAVLLPELMAKFQEQGIRADETAVVLMDENLLPAVLENLKDSVAALNITMGFPVKNLDFSIAMKKLFHLQKQLAKKNTYYHADLLPVLDLLPGTIADRNAVESFGAEIIEHNQVYISPKSVAEHLSGITGFTVIKKATGMLTFLDDLLAFCKQSKEIEADDLNYENISAFERVFVSLRNQLSVYDFLPDIETLEVLINQLVYHETIDFKGEPLLGLQVMGLLETRLLNFKNVIMLSVNEGMLPLGRSQNTYLPFNVRRDFDMHTYLENDSVYAYHFYRLLQGAENAAILFNGLSRGTNTGERSRFITQVEMESGQKVTNFIADSTSLPIDQEARQVEKTPVVMEQLQQWKNRISPTHLTSYLYDPLSFYFRHVLKLSEADELEEELSNREFGNLVHNSLELLYGSQEGNFLTAEILKSFLSHAEEALNQTITEKMNFSLDYYKNGINYIHREVALRALKRVIQRDLKDVEAGRQIQILAIEQAMEGSFPISENETVQFYGKADRIDRVDGMLRIVDYKTSSAKVDKLKMRSEKKNGENLFDKPEMVQPLQLAIYAYCALQSKQYPDNSLHCGIWSFVTPDRGLNPLSIDGEEELTFDLLEKPMESVRGLILEILNPEIPFTEAEKVSY